MRSLNPCVLSASRAQHEHARRVDLKALRIIVCANHALLGETSVKSGARMTAKTTTKDADSKRPGAGQRPLSPHIGVWRWHATMASSIFHRASGVANYLGAVLFTVWLVMVASGPDAYAAWEALRSGPAGILVTLALIAFTLSLSYHLLNGLRHLGWDAGAGYDPKGSNQRSILIFAGSIVVTALIWIFAGGLV
jgi:succinate dehydrogenase / fumarate reductase cytochrome b subunit